MYGDCREQAVGGDKQPCDVVTQGPLQGAGNPHPQDPCNPLQPMADFCLQACTLITTGLTCKIHKTSVLTGGKGKGRGAGGLHCHQAHSCAYERLPIMPDAQCFFLLLFLSVATTSICSIMHADTSLSVFLRIDHKLCQLYSP